jgi:drug/metabolite transporter (DMT)-like permease
MMKTNVSTRKSMKIAIFPWFGLSAEIRCSSILGHSSLVQSSPVHWSGAVHSISRQNCLAYALLRLISLDLSIPFHSISVMDLSLPLLSVLVLAFLLLASQLSDQVQTHYGVLKPFFLVYCSCSSLSLFFIVILVHYYRTFRYAVCSVSEPLIQRRRSHSQSNLAANGNVNTTPDIVRTFSSYVEHHTGLTIRRLLTLIPPFTCLWVCANYCFNLALDYSDVAISLTLVQSSLIFVALMSWAIERKRPDLLHALFLLVCILGAVLITAGEWAFSASADSETTDHSWLGDLLSILSAIASSLYLIGYPLVMYRTGLLANFIWLGFIGLFSLSFNWIILLVLHYSGREPLSPFQSDDSSYPAVSASFLFVLFLSQSASSVCYNFFLNLGLLRISPLYMRLLTLLALPGSFLINFLFFGSHYSHWKLIGSAVIFVGFFGFVGRKIQLQAKQSAESISLVSQTHKLNSEADA